MESLLDSKNGTINTNYLLLSILRLFLNLAITELGPLNIHLCSEMLVISKTGSSKIIKSPSMGLCGLA